MSLENAIYLELNNQAQKVVLSRKTTKSSHPQNVFQNHLGVCLDKKLNFNHHFKKK